MVYQLQKIYNLSSNLYTEERSGIPSWFNNYSDKNSWWYLNGDYGYYFYSIYNDDCFIQYGYNYEGWAAARFFGQNVQLSKQVNNSDGSISAHVKVTPMFFVGRLTDFAKSVGYRVNYSISIADTVVYTFSGSTVQEWTEGASSVVEFDVNVPPETTDSQSSLKISINYPDGEVPNSVTECGIALYNPTPPTYIPMTAKQNGSYIPLNISQKRIKIRKNGSWQDVSEESTGSILHDNTGKNRVKLNDVYKQMPRL